MPEPTATDLRQQYRSKLEAGLTQGRALLDRYQQAYPDLSQIAWSGGGHILGPAALGDEGKLGDPRRQLAFMAAPGLVRAAKG